MLSVSVFAIVSIKSSERVTYYRIIMWIDIRWYLHHFINIYRYLVSFVLIIWIIITEITDAAKWLWCGLLGCAMWDNVGIYTSDNKWGITALPV